MQELRPRNVHTLMNSSAQVLTPATVQLRPIKDDETAHPLGLQRQDRVCENIMYRPIPIYKLGRYLATLSLIFVLTYTPPAHCRYLLPGCRSCRTAAAAACVPVCPGMTNTKQGFRILCNGTESGYPNDPGILFPYRIATIWTF